MFPHEMQAVMAKVIFFIFAIIVLCFSKVRASELSIHASSSNSDSVELISNII